MTLFLSQIHVSGHVEDPSFTMFSVCNTARPTNKFGCFWEHHYKVNHEQSLSHHVDYSLTSSCIVIKMRSSRWYFGQTLKTMKP